MITRVDSFVAEVIHERVLRRGVVGRGAGSRYVRRGAWPACRPYSAGAPGDPLGPDVPPGVGALSSAGYVWYEEFDTLAALEVEPETEACRQAWEPIHELALPASFTGSIWTDTGRQLWFER